MPRLSFACALLTVLAASLVAQRPSGAGGGVRTLPVGALPVAIAVDAPTHRAFVLNQNGYSVSILDTQAARVLRTVPLGSPDHLPQDLTLSARTGLVFALNEGTNIDKPGTLSVLDAHDGHLRAVLPLSANPSGGALDARRSHLFVTSGPALSLLDARSGRLLRSAPSGASPRDPTFAARADRVFVANNDDNTLTTFDAATARPLRTAPVGESPGPMVVDERAGHVFVCNLFGASLDPLDGRAVVPEQDAHSATIVDTRAGRVLRTVHVGKEPVAVAIDARAGRAFIANLAGNSVSVLDVRRGRVLREVPVGAGPSTLAIDP